MAGKTINDLASMSASDLTANDGIPVWDSEAGSGVEPTKKITAANLAARVKEIGKLLGTEDVTKKTYSLNVSGGATTLAVVRFGKVRDFFFFCDQNIANGTVLCTLDTQDIPYQPLSWYGTAKFVYDANHRIEINYGTGNVTYINSNGTGIWGDVRGTYIARQL